MDIIHVGRADDNTIQVPESFIRVSNYHADILLEGGKLLYYDHSSNGTVINNQKIKNMKVHIFSGDNIELPGGYLLSWDMINRYFDSVQRPDIHRNPHNVELNHSFSGSIVTEDVPLPQEIGKKTIVRTNKIESNSFETIRMNQGGQERPTMNKNEIRNIPTEKSLNGLYGSLGGSREDGGLTDEEINHRLGRWNWGAFFLTWIWGLAHKERWTLVILFMNVLSAFLSIGNWGNDMYWLIHIILPWVLALISLGLAVYLGLVANRRAWNNGCYNSIEHALGSIKKWTIAGSILFALNVVLVVIQFL